MMTDYGSHLYWEERYEKGGSDQTFEWYQSYEALKPYIKPWIDAFKKDKVEFLNVGCGNSLFGEQLFLDQLGSVVNIDFSVNVIDAMNQRRQKMIEERRSAQVFSEPLNV